MHRCLLMFALCLAVPACSDDSGPIDLGHAHPDGGIVMVGSLACPTAVQGCGSLAASNDGTAFIDPQLLARTHFGECAPTWTVRGCKCLPQRMLWDSDGTRITDGGTSFVVASPGNLLPPVHAARVAENGVTARQTAWSSYFIPSGSVVGGDLNVPTSLAAAAFSFDNFTDCQ